MDKIEEFMALQDMDSLLKAYRWDKLNLINLDPLRIETKQRMNKIKRK